MKKLNTNSTVIEAVPWTMFGGARKRIYRVSRPRLHIDSLKRLASKIAKQRKADKVDVFMDARTLKLLARQAKGGFEVRSGTGYIKQFTVFKLKNKDELIVQSDPWFDDIRRVRAKKGWGSLAVCIDWLDTFKSIVIHWKKTK